MVDLGEPIGDRGIDLIEGGLVVQISGWGPSSGQSGGRVAVFGRIGRKRWRDYGTYLGALRSGNDLRGRLRGSMLPLVAILDWLEEGW